MPLLTRFDPPAFLADFNSIPGQLEAWHRAVSGWFDSTVSGWAAMIGTQPQYYNPAQFDPGGVAVEQAVTWNAFPKECCAATAAKRRCSTPTPSGRSSDIASPRRTRWSHRESSESFTGHRKSIANGTSFVTR